jgi:phenylacetate-CoA ligase
MNILGSTYITTKRHLKPLVTPVNRVNTQGQLADQFLGEWKSAEDIDADKMLRDILSYAHESVPFYRKYFSKSPEKDPLNLSDWPVLTRDDLWNHSPELQSLVDQPWRSWTHASGGSTGKPVSVVHDEYFAAKAQALRRLCSELFFDGPHYNQLILWGMSAEVEREKKSPQGIKSALKDYLRERMEIKTSHVNTFEFTKEKFDECVDILRHQKPDYIFGYAGSVYELAKYLDEQGIEPPKPPKVIGTTAQTLHPFMRERIEKVFRCRVCDHYGSREVGPIAWQHPDGAMCFPKFFSKVEVVDEQNDPVAIGEQGRILVTTLHNFSMPLIRYDIGDMGVLGEDMLYKGYPFSTLASISGRCSEEFTNVRGSRICGPFFINLFYYRDWLDQFYIVQRDYDHVEIMYVAKGDTPIPEEEKAELDARIKTVMTDECRVTWTKVDNIPTTKSGKRLFIRSEVH